MHNHILRNQPTENQIASYKAYPGISGWLMMLPFFGHGLIAIYMFFLVAIEQVPEAWSGWNGIVFFLVLGGSLGFGAILAKISTDTLLKLTTEGIEYQGIGLESHASGHPFQIETKQIKVAWDDIQSVAWLNGAGGTIDIKTKFGHIKFCVKLRPTINKEIMQEILKRAPHLRR